MIDSKKDLVKLQNVFSVEFVLWRTWLSFQNGEYVSLGKVMCCYNVDRATRVAHYKVKEGSVSTDSTLHLDTYSPC